jgi:hypothetical protein
MRVDVSGYQFTFPMSCACCSGVANAQLTVSASKSSGKRVVHTKTQVWDIPYCTHCLQHVKAVEEAATVAKILTLLSVVGGGFVWYAAAPWIGILLAISGLIGTIILYNHQMTKARGMRSASCVSVAKAVAYLGWYGTLHRFEIVSVDFARNFMVENQRKLVNLSPQAQRMLASGGGVSTPNAPRGPRRYMT